MSGEFLYQQVCVNGCYCEYFAEYHRDNSSFRRVIGNNKNCNIKEILYLSSESEHTMIDDISQVLF